MAARTPTSYDWEINEALLRPRERVLGATMSDVLDNQQFLLDETKLVHTNVFGPLAQTGTTFVQSRVNRAVGVDMLGTGVSRNATGWVYCWSATSGAAKDTFTARLTVDGNSYDLAVTNGDTTPTWRQVSTAITLPNDSTYFSVAVQVRLNTAPAGSEEAYIAGAVLVA